MAEIHGGGIWWANLPEPRGSERVVHLKNGYRRPVLEVQADSFNSSRIQTVIVAAIATNMDLAGAPGNVVLRADLTGLPRDSVLNASANSVDDVRQTGGGPGTRGHALSPEVGWPRLAAPDGGRVLE